MFVVFGATGQTGSVVADTLLEKKLPVRVVLRLAQSATAKHPDKAADAWRSKGADVAFADVIDADAITKALEGAIAVYAINPPAYQAADMFTVAQNIGAAYVEAIAQSSVQKVVLLSSIGSQHATGTGNIMTTYLLENIFGNLAIPVAFLRAAGFMDNWNSVAAIAAEKGILPSFYNPLDRKLPMVAAAEALTEDWAGKRIIELYGAADYSPNDVAAAFVAALKRDVQAVALPESEWQATIASFGFSPQFSDSYSEMMRGFNSGHIVFENNGTETRKGQTTIAAFAAAEALTEDWAGKRIIELYGAADYSPNDVAAAFVAALKRDVQAVALPESEWQATIASFGFSPQFSDSYSEMMRGFNSGHIVFENNGTETRKGQTTIAAFAAETAKAQNLT